MKWADLSNEAKSILEWVEHVWTGKRQVLTIERGKLWVQPVKYVGDVKVPVTDELFDEIKRWLPYSKDTVHKIEDDIMTVTLKDGVRLH
ncbi:hypothetical protein GCM10023310_69940 [Paenibacillus vulneris]|uniref:Uncharacterized protein n=1 Tax=Paenibacillus vulneris TaxID=1133364 RepID=A0ABW3UF43_9BACL